MAPAITDVGRELERIRVENGGLLRAVDVVREAANAASPLHSHFQWDDGVAAAQYRLWQARQLIRVMVTYLPANNTAYNVRVYYSLTPDRTQPGGGYRVVVDVFDAQQLRAQLLAEALREMHHFQHKFRELEELNRIFSAMAAFAAQAQQAPPHPMAPPTSPASGPTQGPQLPI